LGIVLNIHSAFVTDVSAREYHHALGCATTVAASLNERLSAGSGESHSHGGFETCEALAARREKL